MQPAKVQSGLKASVNTFGKLIISWAFDHEQVMLLLERMSELMRANALFRKYRNDINISAPLITLFPDLVERLESRQMSEMDGLISQLRSFLTGMGDTLAAMQLEVANVLTIARTSDAATLTSGIFTIDHVLRMEEIFSSFSNHHMQWHLLKLKQKGSPVSMCGTAPVALTKLRASVESSRPSRDARVAEFLRINGFEALALV
mgnify:CR=1 FL=1